MVDVNVCAAWRCLRGDVGCARGGRYGPLPRDAPNFAVFCALDQDEGTLRVGDMITIDTLAIQPVEQQGGGKTTHIFCDAIFN